MSEDLQSIELATASLNLQASPPSLVHRYQVWRRQWIVNRLRLGLGVILGSFIVFVLLENVATSDPVAMRLLSLRLSTGVALAASWGFSLSVWGSWNPWIGLGVASGSVTLLPQVLASLGGQAFFDPQVWILMFLLQGVCFPVRWWMHAIAQALPLVYFAIAYWLLQLPLVELYPHNILETYLNLVGLSVICSVAVYGFERSRYGEFTAQQKITELCEKLESQTTIDPLTQLANRRRFEEYLEQEWRRMGRELQPLSLIVCQVDAFSHYLYTYGQEIGDECLQQMAQAIQKGVQRPADLIVRYTMDAFIILLPNTDASGAMRVATKIRTAVNQLKIFHANSPARAYVTMSFGVSSAIPQRNSMPISLAIDAEAALHQAKLRGGDRILQYPLNRD